MKKPHTVGSRESGVESPQAAPLFSRPQLSTFDSQLAFTLIELLTVIAIIAVLASLTFPILGSLKRHEYISKTQAELAQLETAIDSYKATYGFYPPGNTNNLFVSQLYFELLGTAKYTNGGVIYYQTLDSSAQIAADTVTMNSAFSVDGFVNSTKPGAGEDAPSAKNFLSDLKPNQFTTTYTNNNIRVALLLASVGGPDANYNPLGQLPPPPYLNPWRYNSSSPTNNPGAYDLWVELKIGGKTNLICNWSKHVETSGRLP